MIESAFDDWECVKRDVKREYQEDRAFALKLNKRDCPLTYVMGQS